VNGDARIVEDAEAQDRNAEHRGRGYSGVRESQRPWRSRLLGRSFSTNDSEEVPRWLFLARQRRWAG
jgi:hypothetical protein